MSRQTSLSVRKSEITLSSAVRSGALAAIVEALRLGGYALFVDYSTTQAPATDLSPDCQLVGVGGPSWNLLGSLLSKLGVRFNHYFTCTAGTDLQVVESAKIGLMTGEWRLRAFERMPIGHDPFAWDFRRFWEAGSGTPEEVFADLVIATRNGGSDLVLLGRHDLVDNALSKLRGPSAGSPA